MSFASRIKDRVAYKWLVVLSITLGMFMSIMDATIVNVAVPKLQAVFGASLANVQWTVTVYMITQAAVIPAAPFLAARFGIKQAWVWTLIAFLLGSILCGFAWNLSSLILFRLIQGLGGGILLPLVLTLLYQTFSPDERGTASSMMSIPLMVAPVLGPVLGGYLVSVFSWRWAFFINIPLGISAIAVAQKALKPSPHNSLARFDAGGFGTIAAGSIALLYAVSELAGGHFGVGNSLLLVLGIGFLIAFVRWEQSKVRRGEKPLLDLRRFRDRHFSFSVITLVLVSFVTFGVVFHLPLYLQNVRHKTALGSGLIQAASAVAMLIVLPISGKLADRNGPRPVVLVGLGLFVGSVVLLATLTLTTPIWAIVAMLVAFGIASALVGQINVAAMMAIPKEEHHEVANASTLISVLRATAAPMGVVALSSLTQAQSQHFAQRLSAQGVSGALLQQQSFLLAMRESFIVGIFGAILALIAMWFVPKLRPAANAEPTSEAELLAAEIP